MCRIAGIISKSLAADQMHARVSLMCAALEHGGPDDQGIFSDVERGLVFGHRRLSIIDLSSKGHQPMADVQQKAWITFNGEIFNYRELKAQLINAGFKFSSDTDTEVIINAYLHWGEASFPKLRGMFAFALYDKVKTVTYLVRDSGGVKPLYYYAEQETLSFASEIKALKAAGVSNENDETWPVTFLAYGHIPEPYTTLKNVFSLAKGHYLSWQHTSDTFEIRRYFNPKAGGTLIMGADEAHERLQAALKAAVTRQLIADAPIGVFLSGGIDSSLISLLANQEKAQQLKTISIYFNEKAYNERAYQNVILERLDGEKFSHLVQQKDFEELFPAIMHDMDMPTTDGINTWFISKYAHDDGLKAVLSGVGADELFGGYPSFSRIKYLKYLRMLPPFLFGAANYFKTDKFRKISFLTNNHPFANYLFLRGLFVPAQIARILGMDEKQVDEILFGRNTVSPARTYDELHAAWFETNLYMQNQLLRDTDVMSMSHGLEVRVPFLDEDFQQLANEISPEIRFNKDQPKKILIDSFKDILPPATWNRPKMGFSFPLQEWMSRHPEISDERLYKGRVAQATVAAFKAGKMHWSKVFALYQIQQNA